MAAVPQVGPMVAPVVAKAPVETYYRNLKDLRLWMKRYTPFTYIAYKTLIPSAESDLIGLAVKVADFITLRFFVQVCAAAISPIFVLIPFIPFFLDLGWTTYQWVRGHQIAPVKPEEAIAETQPRDRIASLFFSALGLGIALLMHQNLPNR